MAIREVPLAAEVARGTAQLRRVIVSDTSIETVWAVSTPKGMVDVPVEVSEKLYKELMRRSAFQRVLDDINSDTFPRMKL